MNKTKIEWADYTWNPVTGCLRGCSYCYARRIANRFQGHFKPTFHPERLNEPLKIKKPSRIFVGSMTDLWGQGISELWRGSILDILNNQPHHQFFILTKSPERITDDEWNDFGHCSFVGVSEEGGPSYRMGYLSILNFLRNGRPFVSFEPLLAKPTCLDLVAEMFWVIIGAHTGQGAKPPKPEWVQAIIDACRQAEVPIFLKNNLNWPEKIQEFPK